MKFCVIFSVLIFLTGCQALQDNAQCWSQVNQQIPAQTQQRYIRTDTQCNSSSSSLASPTTTRGDQYIVNGSGQTNCTSTPIYETIVLNQAERNAAYQQCRNNISYQRSSQQSPQSYSYAPQQPSVGYQSPPSYGGKKLTVDQAIAQCDADGLKKGTTMYGACLRKYTQQ